MAIDLIARGLAKAAKDKTDKITVNNNINLDTVTSDISDIANQLTIQADHVFTDDTARDTYFTANPTELVEGMFIVVGTVYQKRIGGSWVSVTPIISSFSDVMTVEGELWEVDLDG